MEPTNTLLSKIGRETGIEEFVTHMVENSVLRESENHNKQARVLSFHTANHLSEQQEHK